MLAGRYISPRGLRAWAWRSSTAAAASGMSAVITRSPASTLIDDVAVGHVEARGTWIARMKRDGGVRSKRLATRVAMISRRSAARRRCL